MRRALVLAAVSTLAMAIGSLPTITFAQDATPAACPVTTEAENEATARIFHDEGTNKRHPEALLDILAPEVMHHAAGGYSDTTDANGVVAMMSQFLPAFSDLHYTIDFLVAEDDMVVEQYTATGTQDGPLGDLPASGRTASWTGINIFRFECGKIAEIWSEVDALGRNAQLAGDPHATPTP